MPTASAVLTNPKSDQPSRPVSDALAEFDKAVARAREQLATHAATLHDAGDPIGILVIEDQDSAGELPLKTLISALRPGLFEIINDRGEVIARLEVRGSKENEQRLALIQEQLRPNDLEDIRREMRNRGDVSTYAEFRQQVFGQG